MTSSQVQTSQRSLLFQHSAFQKPSLSFKLSLELLRLIFLTPLKGRHNWQLTDLDWDGLGYGSVSNECYTEPDSNTRRWSNRTAMTPKQVLLQDSQLEAVKRNAFSGDENNDRTRGVWWRSVSNHQLHYQENLEAWIPSQTRRHE